MPIARASTQGWRLLSPPSPSARPTTNKRKDSKQIRAWGPHNSAAYLARATEGVGGWGRRPVSARESPVSAREISVGRSSWCCPKQDGRRRIRYSVIATAVSRVPSKTDEARCAIYDRARTALQEALRDYEPLLLAKEQEALDDAIRTLEVINDITLTRLA